MINNKNKSFGLIVWLLLSIECYPNLAYSDEVKEQYLNNQFLEERAQRIFAEVRCMVCKGEAIKDSNARLSKAMRQVIRQKISKGSSDQQVLDFIRDRYGNYAILTPPVQSNTLWLWLLPGLLLLGGAGIFLHIRRFQKKVNDKI